MNLFPRSLQPGLRFKLTLLIESLVLIIIMVTGFITTIREKSTLENELRKRGLALAVDLANFMARPLLSNDLPTLRRFVNQAMEQDYVRYVVILDPKGRVVMHNDLSEVGKTYGDPLSLAAVRSSHPGHTDIHTGEREPLHCDMFTPIQISDMRLGTIRLGYSYMAIQEEIHKARKQIFLIGLLTAIGSGIVVYFLAGYISSPIKRITAATRRVAQGRLDTRLAIDRADEIGVLADAFNRMTEDLLKTTVSKDYFDNIIRSMNDALLVIDPDSKIRSLNRAAGELLDYEERELIGKDLQVILAGNGKLAGDRLFESIQKDPSLVNLETEYRTRSGKRIPVLFSASALRDKEGNIEGAVCMARDMTERKEAENALKESERALHLLSAQLMTAQEKERRRIATELHDELGQSLLVIKLRMRSIQTGLPPDQEGLKKECEEGIHYINEVVENVRRLSRDLSPAILENLGLAAALRWLVESFAEYSKIECALSLDELTRRFSPEEEIILYRMVQECLTNAAKHAAATRVTLSVTQEENRIRFIVEDNGKGFNFQEVLSQSPGRRSLGLSTLNERARMLGTTLNIFRMPDGGTRIVFSVPRQRKEDSL
jgi:PAS domain S-box-containing protein